MALVLGGALLGTLGMSLAGLIVLRYSGPEIGFRNAAIIVSLVIGALTIILALLLVRLLLRPINALAYYAAEVRHMGGPTPETPQQFGTDELYSMGTSVVAMADELSAREASIRSYTAHVTHELKTPVSSIAAAAELLRDSPAIHSTDLMIAEQISGSSRQMQDQLDALRRVGTAREVSYRGECNLEKIRQQLQHSFPNLQLSFEGLSTIIPLNEEGLTLVLERLLSNSEAHEAKQIQLKAESSSGHCRMTVDDDGTGISGGNASRIFDPFFTTRREAGRTGMGLTIVANILQAHNGQIHMLERNTGAAFLVEFQ